MVTMHFLRLFSIFVVMIALGLAGVYLVNTYGEEGGAAVGCVGEEC